MSDSSRKIQFWFEFASTYSYLSVGRIRHLTRSENLELEWKPFLLGPIFKDQGMQDSPFNLFPLKGRYMWKDLERRCKKYGLPFRKPETFPQNGLKAARIATAFLGSDWVYDFILATYKAQFSMGKNIGEESNLEEILRTLGLDPKKIFSASETQENKDLLRKNTEIAKGLGIFGAPSFIVKNELFWGDDRLEDAIEFLKSGDA
ncbi:2-hydroxychromene-2-carboxylate isomerase [Leptospira wolffii]|uniref:2-hydroxychromene-2-carboxylate isomerase n=1 Tax=Leptospira wolffii TaxID=409998 RepID=UPI000318493C|nr:2-hydroxychromene-2-carboxylate isomerase [Leptospira wolffii]EPG68167.1 DSBA-like thioredoxin domain protein [Leptospira wolffii serovar Khorat str. Khorat-H2]